MKKKNKIALANGDIKPLLARYGDPDTINLSPEEMKIIWDLCKPKINFPPGRVLIYGTMGTEGKDLEHMEAMFYKPTNYKFIKKE